MQFSKLLLIMQIKQLVTSHRIMNFWKVRLQKQETLLY